MDVLSLINRIKYVVAQKYAKGKKTDFYKDVGISSSTLSSWKNSEVYPRVETIWRIAEVLDVSPEWLLFGTGPESGTVGSTDRDELVAEINALFRQLSEPDQRRVVAFMQGLAATHDE